MSMTTWAENEVRLACARERAASGTAENDWDYGCSCYESALKAFKSLCEDGHSGFSIQMTKNILNRLIDGQCLTPIEDIPEVWDQTGWTDDNGVNHYQCTRMSALFKEVYPDGTVKYDEVRRIYCFDIDNPSSTWTNGWVRDIINEMYPITMPYFPSNKGYGVACSEFLVDPKNGDFDTMAVWNVTLPDGELVEINRFFKESPDSWAEITKEEYGERYKNRVITGRKLDLNKVSFSGKVLTTEQALKDVEPFDSGEITNEGEN